MFSWLSEFFSSNKIPSVSFFDFHHKMVQWKSSKLYPYPSNLPEAISFPPDFWKDVINIHKLTLGDGKERAISVFWADGELIVTSVVKGDESSVTTNENLSVRYIPHPVKQGYYRKEVILSGKTLKQVDIYYKNAPKSILVEYLFNMHTHPKYIDSSGLTSFSYFSLQDIKSLIGSGAIMTGLVTDKLHILVRTADTPTMLPLTSDVEVTVENLKDKMKLGVYEAEYNKMAVRQ